MSRRRLNQRLPSRKWEDQKGRKMDAVLISVQQNGVVGRSNDSRIWLLSVDMLSDKDSAYIEGLTDGRCFFRR